jgi:hypothetical protein
MNHLQVYAKLDKEIEWNRRSHGYTPQTEPFRQVQALVNIAADLALTDNSHDPEFLAHIAGVCIIALEALPDDALVVPDPPTILNP